MSEKLGTKFPATVCGCLVVKIACIDDTFWEVFLLQASPVEG